MALIPPFFLDAVVAVGFAGDDGKPTYRATGFIYGHFDELQSEKEKTYGIFLVTNRHVLEGKQKAFLRFNPESGESAQHFELNLLDAAGKPRWVAHQDSTVDVAVIDFNAPLLRNLGIRFAWFSSDEHVMSRSKARESGFTEGDGVFVLGFPLGLVGEKKTLLLFVRALSHGFETA